MDYTKDTLKCCLSWSFGALWLLSIILGFKSLLTYAGEPGRVGLSMNSWPFQSSVLKNSSGQTLLVFVHPECSCTRATAAELEQLVTMTHAENLEIYVLLYTPSEVPAHWIKTSLPSKFERMPGVHVLNDKDGVEAQRFGALTSGQTFLYEKDGRLLFKGGITASRGHEGDNQGLDILTALILHQSTQQRETNVYGCGLGRLTQVGLKKDNSHE